MKKILSKIFIVVLIFGFFAPIFANAQATIPPDQTTATATAAPSCLSLGGIQVSACVGGFLGEISTWILDIMSLLLGLAGLLLNWVINETILKMTTNIAEMNGINTAWKVMRDLMNIAFIFLLVYESIKIIIGQSDTGAVKKFITGIVLASILINFSLFFTKVLIDMSNIVTIGFYNSIVSSTPPPTGSAAGNAVSNTLGIDPASYGLSNVFQKSLGLQGFFSSDNLKNVSGNGDNYALLVIGLLGSVLFLITTFVFLAVSVLLIVRYIVLIILLMLSPLGYMGLALGTVMPKIRGYANQWWESLNGQLLFAPVYMIMTWVVLTLMSSKNFVNLDPSKWGSLAANVTNGVTTAPPVGSIELLFNFIIIIGLAIASLAIAKGLATSGASQIKDLSKTAMGFAGGAILGTAGKAGRQTIGRAGNAIANNEKLKEYSVSDNFVARKFGQLTIAGGDKAAKSSFDARSAKIGGASLASIGADFGKGADSKKVNFRKDLEAKGKSEADFAKSLKPTDRAVDKAIEKSGESQRKAQAQEHFKNSNESLENSREKYLARLDEIAQEMTKPNITDARQRELDEEVRNINDRMQREVEVKEQAKANLDQATKEAKEAKERIEKEYKEKFADRVDKYAKSFENESGMWRWTKNILKIPAGAATSLSPNSKNDNREIAKAIKGILKEKKKPTKAALKELGIDVADDTTDNTPVTPPSPPGGGTTPIT